MIDKNPFKPDLMPEVPLSTQEKMLNPSAELVGQALRGIGLKVLGPLLRYQVIKENEMADFTEKIKSKTEGIPLENRDPEKLGITLKAIEDSSYQLNVAELREMFANLVASSLDNRVNAKVLPSFSTILKDFSIDDAQLFNKLYQLNAVATVDIVFTNQSRGTVLPCLSNIILFDNNTMTHKPISINTLERLGLIEVRGASLVQPNFAESYKNFKLENNEYYIHAERQLDKFKTGFSTFDKIKINEGYITMTNLGKRLGEIVVVR